MAKKGSLVKSWDSKVRAYRVSSAEEIEVLKGIDPSIEEGKVRTVRLRYRHHPYSCTLYNELGISASIRLDRITVYTVIKSRATFQGNAKLHRKMMVILDPKTGLEWHVEKEDLYEV